MTAADLLNDFQQRGIGLRAEGDAVEVTAPKGSLSEEDRAAIRDRKPELLRLLSESEERATDGAELRPLPTWAIFEDLKDGSRPPNFSCETCRGKEFRWSRVMDQWLCVKCSKSFLERYPQ